MKKTNAVRLLDKLGIPYELMEYPVDEEDVSAENVASKVGMPLERVFKTLVARGDRTGVLVASIPGGAELDLKKLAALSGNKRVELVALKEVQPLTGYIRGGVSPLGMKKTYPYFLDESAFHADPGSWSTVPAFPLGGRISVSAGVRGCQIVLEPEDLRRATGAVTGDLIHSS
ncbi:Cys-tRNA(Pro) deacylase [Aminiphilus circumscriptus]|jgi:Cys-tRNA(Pro)/Cys-tRNA(Cys) deacylase|uniref:Cys-tRNA(Pro) deacylase n=1 Tax=Aminiphilus circumscriptus TaxID=290732 RepID=UPI000492879E|nr:Cys-tRNA(Pro) deacylase [Aminiphilus circumscriptus]